MWNNGKRTMLSRKQTSTWQNVGYKNIKVKQNKQQGDNIIATIKWNILNATCKRLKIKENEKRKNKMGEDDDSKIESIIVFHHS